MRVVKILNNNYILAADADGNEYIVMGKGLRFSYQIGSELKEESIRKTFVSRDEKERGRWQQILENVPDSYAEVIQEAILMADRAMPGKLNGQIFITLFDHLVFALERLEKKVILQNRLLWEIRQFYPKEFALGEVMIAHMNDRLHVTLPEEEAGNIAFHLVNAQTENPNMEQTLLAVRMLKDIFRIVQFSFQHSIRTDSVHYTRFVTHMQFFLQRVMEHKMLSDNDVAIFKQIKDSSPESYVCADRISDYVKKTLQVDIPQEEVLYLMLHISRIIS
ncbi:Cryptic beta-glucoside bgl operon antiterminator [Eubacterium plexicaudatum ASF492]|uniref:PRD domain-containing protein n=1 Tax=Eubacterium plexicaudatum ASF492 TaxID=1235802 RepID=N2A0K1_9FIRM|nr:Cryptic beta-glucoside bgl operon antiterminator [Eubacterium plexicaudatum ASF492]